MKKLVFVFSIFALLSSIAFSDTDIVRAKKQMIQESIDLYSGPCPCPYNVMKNGRECKGNSAHSKPRGASPLCFPSDISDKDAKEFLKRK